MDTTVKEYRLKGPRLSFCDRRNSLKSGSVGADSTVLTVYYSKYILQRSNTLNNEKKNHQNDIKTDQCVGLVACDFNKVKVKVKVKVEVKVKVVACLLSHSCFS